MDWIDLFQDTLYANNHCHRVTAHLQLNTTILLYYILFYYIIYHILSYHILLQYSVLYYIILYYNLLTTIGLSPGGSGYYACTLI